MNKNTTNKQLHFKKNIKVIQLLVSFDSYRIITRPSSKIFKSQQ
jgi:hypothetical protein